MTQLSLKLVHLYPLFLNIYGDIGNVVVLKKRCEWRGIDLQIEQININDKIEEGTDIYFMGGGQDRQQIEVSEELQKHKSILTAE